MTYALTFPIVFGIMNIILADYKSVILFWTTPSILSCKSFFHILKLVICTSAPARSNLVWKCLLVMSYAWKIENSSQNSEVIFLKFENNFQLRYRIVSTQWLGEMNGRKWFRRNFLVINVGALTNTNPALLSIWNFSVALISNLNVIIVLRRLTFDSSWKLMLDSFIKL